MDGGMLAMLGSLTAAVSVLYLEVRRLSGLERMCQIQLSSVRIELEQHRAASAEAHAQTTAGMADLRRIVSKIPAGPEPAGGGPGSFT